MYKDLNEKDACGVGFIANRFGSRSHEIIEMATRAVTNLTHRGAVAADAKTGDGAGILTQIPGKLFQKHLEKLGVHLDTITDLGVGMIFLPRYDQNARRKVARSLKRHCNSTVCPSLGGVQYQSTRLLSVPRHWKHCQKFNRYWSGGRRNSRTMILSDACI